MLPIMIDVKGKQVTIIGGGRVAYRKLSVFLGQGAKVTVISPDVVEQIRLLHEECRILWIKRKMMPNDLTQAFIVIAATDKQSVNAQVKAYSKDNQLICVADDGDCGNIHMVSYKQKGNLTVAVSTGGASPFLAKKLTDQFFQPFDDAYIEKIDHISQKRKEIKASDVSDGEKRKRLKELTERM
ncbi:NAD(P)-dependent oxidoreductase [Rossellomorea sp. AcN35-11]|nr:NAD(P)-binding protein [Rossellomorea aquimaris]WJV28554.1 NAD(P)-dependent oxidoreductase [Rossellomorea sp. AcN35-11]